MSNIGKAETVGPSLDGQAKSVVRASPHSIDGSLVRQDLPAQSDDGHSGKTRKTTAIFAGLSQDEDEAMNRVVLLREQAEILGFIVIREYADLQLVAHPLRWHGFKQLKQDASRSLFTHVLVPSISCLGLSLGQILTILLELGRLNLGLVACDGSVDTTADCGSSLLTFAAALADAEHELLSRRSRIGLARAKAKGKLVGRRPRAIDASKALALRDVGVSWRKIGTECGSPWQTLYRRLRREGRCT